MIELVGLRRSFGPKVAVAGLDLAIPEGELFCCLGPNGAGKTTTIRMMTGLLEPSAGRVTIGGFDLGAQPLAAKRLLGYVPDHPFLYERLTGREMLGFVAGLYQLPEERWRERAEELLAIFELAAVSDQLIESYSHGMRQKLSFASTFLHEPKVLIVDEPWVGLDPKNIRSIKSYLREQTNLGLTVFMSTHSLAIAEELADRVGILHQGRLLSLGTVAETKALAGRPGSLEDVFLELTRADE